MVSRAFHSTSNVVLLVYLVPYLVISYDVLGEAVEGIMEGDPFDENFLMSIATIGALLIGFLPNAEPQFIEGVFVMLFFQLGELFEHYAEDKARDSISELMDIRPDVANVERNGVVASVSPEEVKIGETVIVKPGEKIPLDGRVLEGSSSLNTVALTGESMPRDISAGMEVISGCVNLSGVLKVQSHIVSLPLQRLSNSLKRQVITSHAVSRSFVVLHVSIRLSW